ncbi:hypothetical protein [Variovorax sp. RKNM96]|uniref:hypothetical protein n=1 Tax=Variovorax sp. RKNM96 TaxID=2681552 RepID=UPI001F1263ED|nr:hypothetical protein [Variovorax sp. RKNM96]
MSRSNRHAARMLLALGAALAGCAPAVRSVPTQLIAAEQAASKPSDLRFTAPLQLRLETGYSRLIPADSRWAPAGRLNEGLVYRPVDLVFSIEGQQVHEAWLVVRNSTLQGFYLPAEARYSSLTPPVPLPKGTQP